MTVLLCGTYQGIGYVCYYFDVDCCVKWFGFVF